MKRIVTITIIAALAGVCFDHAQAQVSSPLDIQFRRQAVRRLVFDHDSAIPLSILAGFRQDECQTIHWRIIVDGMEKQDDVVTLETPVKGPFILRVQYSTGVENE